MNELERMEKLIAELDEASEAYYGGKPDIMTDAEWNAKFDELKALEDETGTVLKGSPTNKVSTGGGRGEKVGHAYPALSLPKSKDPNDLVKWADGRPTWLSWKEDGCTLVATYENGKLVLLATRGDGFVGQDVTRLAPAIAGLPSEIWKKGELVVRGECLISYADFERFLEESGGDYANPRNLAAGSLTLETAEEAKGRGLTFKPFTLVKVDAGMRTRRERMEFLRGLGFDPVEEVYCEDEKALLAAIDEYTAKQPEYPYPVDGLVVAYDDAIYAESGSMTGHHSQRGGFAFKWQDEEAETTLERIDWSVAANAITPVAVFEPVSLEGTTVTRASLHNVSEAKRIGVGGRGTKISVYKANKIIPQLTRTIEKVGEFEVPETCPVCGGATKVERSDSGTEILVCSNPACAGKRVALLERFVSRDGMAIDGLAVSGIHALIDAGLVKSRADFFKLKDARDEIAALPGFGGKSADNLIASVERSRKRGPLGFLTSLGIVWWGKDALKKILGVMSAEKLLEGICPNGAGLEDGSVEERISSVKGFGPEKAKAFADWFRDPDNFRETAELMEEIDLSDFGKEPERKGSSMAGLTFVVTGSLNVFASREAMKEHVEAGGGALTGSVTKKTSFLVTNDAESGSSKNRKARELGVPIVTEAEFVERFGGPDEG